MIQHRSHPRLRQTVLASLALSFGGNLVCSAAPTAPIVSNDLVFEEKEGLLAVEAEHFYRQSVTDVRAWHLTSSKNVPDIQPDGDPSHAAGASGGAYLESLPDTRRTHADKLIGGENFSNEPGKQAVLHYRAFFNQPGRYYVWVRAYSTGSEDNGLHVGLDGEWPASGQRLQWCEGKNSWRWESKQRTAEQHCGEPYKIFLDIRRAGQHEILFSMREDGFEFDKFVLTTDREFGRPEGTGPHPRVKSGGLPDPFPAVAGGAQTKAYPAHWGTPPQIQTMDYRPLPGGYGHGSSTLANWIQTNLDRDRAKTAAGDPSLKAAAFLSDHTDFYLDRERFLAINPDTNSEAKAEMAFPYPSGRYDVTLHAAGENDGESTYSVSVSGKELGTFVCPMSEGGGIFEEGPRFNHTWKEILVGEGDVIAVRARIGSKDGEEHSRARWSKLTFAPADDDTRAAVADLPTAIASEPPTVPTEPLVLPRGQDGDGSVRVSGSTKQWHKLTLTLNGPFAHELDNQPNPFLDYRMTVTFAHASGAPVYEVPGYFAADGNAAQTSAESGTKWRAHLSPDKPGRWSFEVSFVRGKRVAVNAASMGVSMAPFDGMKGFVRISRTDKSEPDLRAEGRLQYVGKHHLRFADSGRYFLKAGPDAPETLLAYKDFDGTYTMKSPLKTWEAHVKDWRPGNPTWQSGKGKGLIGALNYLARKGCNVFSFLPYNGGGDGENVWPFVKREAKFHYDCSKLDQWQIVFDHAQPLGLYLHFKLQEQENDDNRKGNNQGEGEVVAALDGGDLGPERKLYCRELIARFSHELALNWNLGEENTQSSEQQRAMAQYIRDTDPYNHHIVVHTFPNAQDRIYPPLLGDQSALTGASLQNDWSQTHQRTLQWVTASAKAGKPWVVANDEQGPASLGVPPDPGYDAHSGVAEDKDRKYTLHDIRQATLWGNLMAGGAGVEYYFGYKLPQNDLVCEDFRSRDRSWDYCRIALRFFAEQKIPFWEMRNANALVGNAKNDNRKYCLAKHAEVYLVYLAKGGTSRLDLAGVDGRFRVRWFDPRNGGELQAGSVRRVAGGGDVSMGSPPAEPDQDWLVVIRR